MSGAGPCLIAFTVEKAVPVGEAMVAAFAAEQITSRYVCLNVDYEGAKVIETA